MALHKSKNWVVAKSRGARCCGTSRACTQGVGAKSHVEQRAIDKYSNSLTRGQVALAKGGDDHHHQLARVLGPPCHLNGRLRERVCVGRERQALMTVPSIKERPRQQQWCEWCVHRACTTCTPERVHQLAICQPPAATSSCLLFMHVPHASRNLLTPSTHLHCRARGDAHKQALLLG